MKITTAVISLIVLGAFSAGGYWLLKKDKLTVPALNAHAVSATSNVTAESPAPTVPAESSPAESSEVTKTEQTASPTNEAPVTGPVGSEEEMTRIRQKLVDIQKLPPEERAKAMLEFRNDLMKQHGLTPSTEQSESANPASAS